MLKLFKTLYKCRRIFTNVYRRIRTAYLRYRLTSYATIVEEIKAAQQALVGTEDLQAASLQLQHQVQSGSALEDVMIEAYALALEAIRRSLGVQLFDEQIVAGIALHQGKLIEMQTGEGKTFAACLPAYLQALSGQGVHVLTFNDYLAERDAKWLRQVYSRLGMSVAHVMQGMTKADRKIAYAAAITYVSAKEAGFDYLRDSICYHVDELVHRPFHYAIVDEADSILIDEARVPLVIAGEKPLEENQAEYMALLARQLVLGRDFFTDDHQRNVYLTERGIDRVEELLQCDNLYAEEHVGILTELHCALHAKVLLTRDVDYIIRDDKVELIDSFTGRVAENRHWPDGLQTAVLAKEGLPLGMSGKLLGTLTLKQLLSLYPKISGMTATAKTSTSEFKVVYNLETVIIPPHRPSQRIDYPPKVFTHQEAKYQAILDDIKERHATGQPILIGTASVEESERLARRLRQVGIYCEVLNAKNDQQEAEIIAQAGQLGAVTVSTNMAGRGVDIRLGGDAPETYEQVVARGGLYIIGTTLHESIRIDNQLKGRAGRQGDPGASRFYVSLEDELLQRYGIDKVVPSKYIGKRQLAPIESELVQQRIEHIQRVVDGQNVEIRKTLNKYSDIIEEQRQRIALLRRQVLLNKTKNSLLASREPAVYEQAIEKVGRKNVEAIEQKLTLYVLDKLWSEHLEYINDLREGIHLESLGNNLPIDEFHIRVNEAFSRLLEQIDDEIMQRLLDLDYAKQLDLESQGFTMPASTWTYIINDTFIEKKFKLF